MASQTAHPNEPPAATFEAVALPWMDALYHRALSLARRPEDARDLVQETYLRAYRSFAGFTAGTNCKAWLFTILYSIFVNKYRKARREPDTVSLDDLDDSFSTALTQPEWPTDFAALASAELDWTGPEVHAALENLPENFRAAVLLVDVDGFTYEEAAAVADCPVGTLRSRLFRARRLLWLALHDYAQRMGLIRKPKD